MIGPGAPFGLLNPGVLVRPLGIRSRVEIEITLGELSYTLSIFDAVEGLVTVMTAIESDFSSDTILDENFRAFPTVDSGGLEANLPLVCTFRVLENAESGLSFL